METEKLAEVDLATLRAVANTPNMSWEAKGVWMYALMGGNTRQDNLLRLGDCGRDKIQRIMRELVEAGAAEFVRNKDERGVFLGGTCYLFYPPSTD